MLAILKELFVSVLVSVVPFVPAAPKVRESPETGSVFQSAAVAQSVLALLPAHVFVAAWADAAPAKNIPARSAYRAFRSPLNNAGVWSEFLKAARLFMRAFPF